jgi:2-keto-4-pentenoate hydratase/2-oxohepta-3-ene-1,7-dioic acid hydratase in catechol pathway
MKRHSPMRVRRAGWFPSRDAYWFAPVPRPGKVICIGLNYRDHAAESNMPIPEKAGHVFEVFQLRDCAG